ncbi:cation:proton antiporter [Embleya hyalina]|uniref:Na+/H+ antiporter subunit G n=1 Tax=Embleya hyalina TaxID=516124 RepID=A0A401YV50_9ACTN|nr:monovalent cation/H(+) antiporter subunit G [Embleya hyalina]GCD98470.1 Na+/H+ antiporter subunit G [Embleya hyalina]
MRAGEFADGAAVGCLLAGCALAFVAGVGLSRFPDTLSRMHTVAKPQVLGLLLVTLGLGLRLRSGIDVGMLVMVAFFQLTTVPVATHLVGHAVYRLPHLPTGDLVVDELADRPDPAG